jgi:hypothetical protein
MVYYIRRWCRVGVRDKFFMKKKDYGIGGFTVGQLGSNSGPTPIQLAAQLESNLSSLWPELGASWELQLWITYQVDTRIILELESESQICINTPPISRYPHGIPSPLRHYVVACYHLVCILAVYMHLL